MSASVLATLDLEDLSPRQLRKLLRGAAESQKPYSKKSKEQKDEDDETASKENDDLVDLHREKGDSKPPKVEKDDLPDALKDEDEDESPEDKKDKK